MSFKIKFFSTAFQGAPLYPISDSALVTVIHAQSNAVASLWSNRSGSSAKANPFRPSGGKIEFYADPGRYNITVAYGGDSQTENDVIIEGASPPVEVTSSFTLGHNSYGKTFVITGSGNVNITVPPSGTTDLGEGFWCQILHLGTGTVTVVEGSGVTVTPPSGGTLVVGQSNMAALIYDAVTADNWALSGGVVSA